MFQDEDGVNSVPLSWLSPGQLTMIKQFAFLLWINFLQIQWAAVAHHRAPAVVSQGWRQRGLGRSGEMHGRVCLWPMKLYEMLALVQTLAPQGQKCLNVDYVQLNQRRKLPTHHFWWAGLQSPLLSMLGLLGTQSKRSVLSFAKNFLVLTPASWSAFPKPGSRLPVSPALVPWPSRMAEDSGPTSLPCVSTQGLHLLSSSQLLFSWTRMSNNHDFAICKTKQNNKKTKDNITAGMEWKLTVRPPKNAKNRVREVSHLSPCLTVSWVW